MNRLHVIRLFATFLIVSVCAAHPASAQSADVPVMNCEPAQAESIIDANNVRAKILNSGALFSDWSEPVYEVSKGSGKHSMFTASIWLAGLVNGEVRASASRFGIREYWPGPYDEVAAGADCAAYDRIYKVERRDFNALESGVELSLDILKWPWQHAAPVVDGDSNPDNYDLAAGDRPLLLGDEMHYWIMNDIGNEHRSTKGLPMGLEVHAMAFSSASTLNPHYANTRCS